LFLEVNIGSNKPQGKLLVFEEDNPDEVVRVFSKYYNLSENKRVKLSQIVRVQLNQILEKIGEADYEDESNTYAEGVSSSSLSY
jgi:hypothetical protein